MPFIIAALGALAAVYFFFIRARGAADMAGEVLDAANDVRLAARRFGFRRRTSEHPADAIEDPNIARAGLGEAFLELDDLPSREQRDALTRDLAQVGGLSRADAEELLILGRWMMGQCGGAAQAVPRLSRKLYKMEGAEGFAPMMTLVQGIAQSGSGGLSTSQQSALDDIRRAFRIT